MKLKMPVFTPPRRPRPARPPKKKLDAVVRATMSRAAREEDFDDEEEYDSEPNMKLSHAFMVVLVLHVIAIGGLFAFNSIKARQIKVTESQAALPKTTEQAETAAPAPAKVQTSKTEVVAERKAAAPAVQAAPSTKAASGSSVHEVAAGETLAKIASAHGVTVVALQKENGLSTYSAIKTGQKLKIPARATETAKTAAPAAPVKAAAPAAAEKKAPAAPAAAQTTQAAAPAAPAAGTVYEVKKGDNPYTIAKRFKVKYAELLKANNITDPTKLQIGQKLEIPKSN